MEAAVSSVWAKPGAWALEAEEHDAELQKQAPLNRRRRRAKPSLSPISLPTALLRRQRLTQAELVSLPSGTRECSPRSSIDLSLEAVSGAMVGVVMKMILRLRGGVRLWFRKMGGFKRNRESG